MGKAKDTYTYTYALNMSGEMRRELDALATQHNVSMANLIRAAMTIGQFAQRELRQDIIDSGLPLETALPSLVEKYVKLGLYVNEVQKDPNAKIFIERSDGKGEVIRERAVFF